MYTLHVVVVVALCGFGGVVGGIHSLTVLLEIVYDCPVVTSFRYPRSGIVSVLDDVISLVTTVSTGVP